MASFFVIVIIQILECRSFPVYIDLACPEVNTAGNGAVNAAQVDDQLTVHVEPEIIVSGKFKDNVVSPLVQSVRGLGKGCAQFHSEIGICLCAVIFDRIELLVLSGIEVRKLRVARRGIQVLPVDRAEGPCLQVVVGQELPVFERIPFTG